MGNAIREYYMRTYMLGMYTVKLFVAHPVRVRTQGERWLRTFFVCGAGIANEPVRRTWHKSPANFLNKIARIRQLYSNYPMRLNRAVGFSSWDYRRIDRKRAAQKAKLPYLQMMRRNERQGSTYSSMKNSSTAWSKHRFRSLLQKL